MTTDLLQRVSRFDGRWERPSSMHRSESLPKSLQKSAAASDLAQRGSSFSSLASKRHLADGLEFTVPLIALEFTDTHD
jgi:hypothetical protein